VTPDSSRRESAMRLASLVALILCTPFAAGQGMLLPTERSLPPLAMTAHHVRVAITDQVAVTTVEQTFRNHAGRPLEATYVFPVPRGASVNKFAMWVDGKETAGELLAAKDAAKIYTDIVRRLQDPGLLEYLDNGMLRLRVFPVPPHGDQKVKVSFTSVLPQDGGVNEYTYPLKPDTRSPRSPEATSIRATIETQHPIQTVYSPTHAITVNRSGEKKATVEFDGRPAMLDKDFQLFFATGTKDVGLTTLASRPVASDDGYAMLMINPQIDAAKAARVPRDLVMVLDTSGSMSEQKMDQAKKALKFCLNNLDEKDRFAVVTFSTTVRNFKDELSEATGDQRDRAKKWVDDLRAGGGTAILPGLEAALALRTKDVSRTFTVVFFTDGLPTVDETNPDKIVKAIAAKNSDNVRIFSFGVGDDVNASMLDRLSEVTRAVSTYVRPTEDIEIKVSGLHSRISHPVMTDVKITATNVTLSEVYPPKLPDLFRGQQLIVMGRYSGQGPAAIKLSGRVGSVEKEIIYELTFPAKTDDGKNFVEDLWARRKVGYLIDQIRANGESKELVAEVVKLAKRYGIATPYTSYLVVPDGPMPSPRPGSGASTGSGGVIFGGVVGSPPPALRGATVPPGGAAGIGAPGGPGTVADFAKREAESKGSVAQSRGEAQKKIVEDELKAIPPGERNDRYADALRKAQSQNAQLERAGENFRNRNLAANQQGTLGVDLAEVSNQLRNQTQLSQTGSRFVNGRNCVDVGGVWIDDQFHAKAELLAVKSQSDAYFRLLQRQPKMREVYRLGNHFVWLTPSGTALVVDPNDGKENLTDKEIDALFVAKK
jgi:Ca-activated chloride channel family protein